LSRAASLLAAALFSGAAAAEWTAVGRANEIYSAYADRATLKRAGAVATLHGLFDFRRQDFTPEGRGLYSTAVLKEFDCEGRRARLVSAIDFAGPMGAGEAVSTSTAPGRWETVVDGGIDDAFWQIACSGK
jgi:hypothetical protein